MRIKTYVALALVTLATLVVIAASNTRYAGSAANINQRAIFHNAGTLYRIEGQNNGVDVYVQIFSWTGTNKGAVPVLTNGAVPVLSQLTFGGLSYTIDLGPNGLNLPACAIASSSSSSNLTSAGNVSITAIYSEP